MLLGGKYWMLINVLWLYTLKGALNIALVHYSPALLKRMPGSLTNLACHVSPIDDFLYPITLSFDIGI